ncbi:uncharacterized protein LOC113203514 [Frankliniella occidentalis]|uniref:Uncharacterized protein LOC113203514 n=1 Tax=Frankliniella occidentalis TaxID=133901 RepID=A0A6J1RYL4_FRAOC|nr:uncharacterized protein LOC113203514 [Frankliniella occidentalis]
MTMTKPTLRQLPAEILMLVMQHLSVDDLLACRLVCRRLGSLVLQPEVWCRRQLGDDKPCLCAVLCLAPCLDKVVFSNKVHTKAFTMTRCAVRHLTLHIKKGTECAQACVAVLKQELLGRLRSVELEVWHSPEDVAPLDSGEALLKTLVSCSSGLESLDLHDGLPRPYTMRPVLHGPLRSSLTYFRCEISEASETFVNTVLAGHAASLEEVHLGSGDCKKDTFQLFVGVPNLRSLTCLMFPGMQVLASCQKLRDVSFYADDRIPEPVVRGAAKFFRLARKLRSVSVEFCYSEGDRRRFMELLEALCSSGESLEQLSVVCPPNLPPLLRALPRLPALQLLGVLVTTLIDPLPDGQEKERHKFLVGITPATAPSLRRLELSTNDTLGCLHEWLHRDAVARVLTANPSLHIHVWGTHGCNFLRWRRQRYCEACAMGCHREATGNFEEDEERRVGLFSHGPGKCTHPEDHVTGDKWTWIHIHCNSD